MKLLVFGSEGNIGKNTCKDLLTKFDIIGFDLKKKSKINYNFQKMIYPKKIYNQATFRFFTNFHTINHSLKISKMKRRKNILKLIKILNTCLNISKIKCENNYFAILL